MLRSKLLMLIMSGALIFASCSDSGTDSDTNGGENGNGEEETVEPTASVNNPSDGATLEGEITFSVEGESEDGFDELRVYVGEEQVETVDSPSLPYEYALATYEHNNGDYDLRAELDPSAKDTTIEASISVTLENYMVSLDTDGYIKSLKDNNDAAYMFIADPEGNVLREVELTSLSDGMHKFLPPSSIDGSAPDHFTYTLARETEDFQGTDAFYLDTDVGLESWSTINKTSSSSSGSGGSSSTTDRTIEMNNFDQEPGFTYFYLENYPSYPQDFLSHSNDDFSKTISIPDGSEDLVITHMPHPDNVSDPVPLYKWEKEPENLSNPTQYDVSNDFKKFESHTLTNTSNLSIDFYYLWMTIADGSFEEGDMIFDFVNPDVAGDANGSDSGFGMWVPQITERTFITTLYASDKSNSNVSYRYQTPVMEGFPDEFHIVEAKVNITNQSMDNVAMDINGSADFIRLSADASTDTYTQSWDFGLPDTTSSFVVPKIADSLDSSVSNYNRSDFTFTYVTSADYSKFENGYDSYLELVYGTKDFGYIIGWANRTKALNTGSSKVRARAPKMESKATPSVDHSPYSNKRAVREGNMLYRNR